MYDIFVCNSEIVLSDINIRSFFDTGIMQFHNICIVLQDEIYNNLMVIKTIGVKELLISYSVNDLQSLNQHI